MSTRKRPPVARRDGPPADVETVSLAEASRLTGRMLRRGASTSPQEEGRPSLKDLTESLLFSPGDGRIWLDKQRMVLLHSSTFGAIRAELLHALGKEQGRQALERVGYAQGKRDAELVMERWADEDSLSQWQAGPSMHTLQGFARVRTLNYEFDVDEGVFRGEYQWHDSVEAEEHIAKYGLSDGPVCWMLTAYVSGYASTMLGFPIVCRERECRGTGHASCELVAKPAHEWESEAPGFAAFVFPEQTSSNGRAPSVCNAPVSRSEQRDPVIDLSAPFIAARQQLELVAPTQATVLLRGESGVGKELFAKTLHELSARCDGPFIAVNCAAIPDNLVEAELFGVERGAYTGATNSRPGRFERAQGGTIFLDEIASMTASAQGKLLRALQEREIERVGGTKSIHTDVRVVAATNLDLWQEVEAQRFRRDLFFRLNVFPIDIPSLCERRDDIPFLVEHFLRGYSQLHKKQIRGLTGRAMQTLLAYNYPGNVRELQNLIERGVICARDGGLIDSAQIFRHGEASPGGSFILGTQGRLRSAAPTKLDTGGRELRQMKSATKDHVEGVQSLVEMERRLCVEALDLANQNVAAAARKLGLTRPTLEYRLRKWGILPQPRRAKDA
ncbi:sigma-54-dependent Fis family transcriptional regulator [Paraburkholderia sp. MM5384-R2]|uniref:sigma-54-dependent Fis family transcriptional regulator n=1 Tax=Paraburkholderia sp. MM5384-R2 TaxID=2723097 RepID=UPI00161E3A42|nr:sigma-54-dependent Fis family transcriptional regulator [Paraburkholderia sp. MM5384-R2]MBB5499399.1 DNA-binding NtrC family response regulator/predicted hydrocarbon binding protein [Paraburkholderia sp. MM5384-R2]